MKLDILGKVPTAKLAPKIAKFKSAKPEILLCAGVASILAGTVLACKATLKLEEHVADKDEALDEALAKAAPEGSVIVYDEMEERKAKATVYLQMAGHIAKDYAPAVALLGGGIGMIVGSHNILRARMTAIAAAYATLEQAHEKYRSRVVEEYGEDVDRKFRLGIHDEVVEERVITKSGKEKVKKHVEESVHADGSEYSMYARYFDQFNSDEHMLDQGYNLSFLLNAQNQCNERLKRKGWLMLNDVYRELGFKEVPEGQLVGWKLDNPNGGDNYVDFGIFEVRNRDALTSAQIGGNAKETCFVLDFNVDGLMWDQI